MKPKRNPGDQSHDARVYLDSDVQGCTSVAGGRMPGATVTLFMPCGCIRATNYICFVYGWALGIFGDLIQDHNNKNLAIVVSIRCGANQGWVSKRILDS